MRVALYVMIAAGFGWEAGAQGRVVAYVPSAEATATGVLMVSGELSVLGGASVVTAGERTAHVRLDRGGMVSVCQTSVMHLAASAAGAGGREAALLIALDRGAMEIQMGMGAADAVMTPDLRFSRANPGNKDEPLALRIRVTPNGDTCVENRGRKAPVLTISDVFGEGAYQLKAGQHVLFEHGSLREVVDRETTSCGCPAEGGNVSLAEAAVRGAAGDAPAAATKSTAEAHPFPLAVSAGLAPAEPIPPETPGGTHVQVATTMNFDPSAEKGAAPATPVVVASPTAPAVSAVPSAATQQKPGLMHSVGRFFRRLFVR